MSFSDTSRSSRYAKQTILPIYQQSLFTNRNQYARKWNIKRALFLAIIILVIVFVFIQLVSMFQGIVNDIEKQVYVTMMTNDNYKDGAMTLTKSIRRTNSKHKVYCMITEEVTAPVREELK